MKFEKGKRRIFFVIVLTSNTNALSTLLDAVAHTVSQGLCGAVSAVEYYPKRRNDIILSKGVCRYQTIRGKIILTFLLLALGQADTHLDYT